ncbi:MAG TPA: argininosuccinate lyase [Symbiobacteriaceae bacterium]|nr:argininosuccinate lyase [Symbiobacteriaceae bacterium]
MSRSAIYVKTVLAPCFEVAKRRFYERIMDVNLAHVIMLHDRKIIPARAGQAVAACLLAQRETPPTENYNPRYEDLFFLIEARVEASVGEENAGHMHVAFSRNDLDAAIFRMALREDLLGLADGLLAVRAAVLALATQHRETVMPAHTHNQQAQPTTLAHYLLAVEGNLCRDTERLLAILPRLNRSPMGACALATTGFPIDRHQVGGLLGFDGLVINAYDAVSGVDHVLETGGVLQTLGANLSRFVCDLLLWSTNEFAVLTLPDPLVQISSIMPQKRNPVALEHLRAILSRLLGQAGALFLLAHNVPLGDINDVGDDLQPVLEGAVHEACAALTLMAETVRHVQFDVPLLARRARDSFAPVTELADTLVRTEALPFRQAHHVVAALVARLRHAGKRLSESTLVDLDEAAKAVLGRSVQLTEPQYQAAIDPVTFVERRSVLGGPAPLETTRALAAAQSALQAAQDDVTARRTALAQAQADLLAQANRVAHP